MQGSAFRSSAPRENCRGCYPERYLYSRANAAKVKVKHADYAGKPVSQKVTLKVIEQKMGRRREGERKTAL